MDNAYVVVRLPLRLRRGLQFRQIPAAERQALVSAEYVAYQQVADGVLAHRRAMHRVVVIDLEIAVQGRLPAGTVQVTLREDHPVVEAQRIQFGRKVAEPGIDIECDSRRQAGPDQP